MRSTSSWLATRLLIQAGRALPGQHRGHLAGQRRVHGPQAAVHGGVFQQDAPGPRLMAQARGEDAFQRVGKGPWPTSCSSAAARASTAASWSTGPDASSSRARSAP